jgi:hypothetical protein
MGAQDRPPHEVTLYPTVDGDEVQSLRAEKDLARTKWRRTHVELSSAARQGRPQGDADIVIETFDAHLAALHDWQAAETAFIAARLGFRHQPLPRRH